MQPNNKHIDDLEYLANLGFEKTKNKFAVSQKNKPYNVIGSRKEKNI